MMTDVEMKDNNPGIVCSVTGMGADVFIRNSEGRLVPLIRPLFERLKKSRENLLPLLRQTGKEDMAGFLDGSFDELSVEDFSEEYWAQTPNEKESKRRKCIEVMKDLVIELGLWSKQLINDESLAERLKSGEGNENKTLSDYQVSRLENYPTDGIHTVVVANKSLDADSIKLIWDEQIKRNTTGQ